MVNQSASEQRIQRELSNSNADFYPLSTTWIICTNYTYKTPL
jgi:hypothetical protein